MFVRYEVIKMKIYTLRVKRKVEEIYEIKVEAMSKNQAIVPSRETIRKGMKVKDSLKSVEEKISIISVDGEWRSQRNGY